MAANTVNVQLLGDTGELVVSKAVGYFNDTVNTNSVLISANTLRFANNSADSCIVQIEEIQYTSSMIEGYARLFYSGANGDGEVITLSTGSGVIRHAIPNSADAPTGNVEIEVYNAKNGDSFSLIAIGRKVRGFANAALVYAASERVL